ncbi:thiamine pyrophosphate-binding protein [Mesorhizobium sp. WSM4906]|uniref:thiamine pyrophosphate-binding protein n=1 Tax=Mesorhizobium sp. WSM4906 TaxID=3038546 RepID=UPI002415F678|nr:thiamine pyrophosphate-binding protein [Mesorhizobium sp. WSM4906]WFP79135.1 thiamine pyrophosphate-binding protein [Mesorhizobium sp. WSM4906]
MRVYEAIVKGLEGIGVGAAFGGAGENAAGLMLALKHSKSIRPVITRHEQAASFIACGYAMLSGRLGVCFATAGPGAFNLFSGLAVAMSDSYPVLAISGYASRTWTGKGALNETSGVSRTPNSQAMFAATTKKSFLLTDASKTCDVLEEAVNIAFEGRPGPVHIHVPEDLTDHGVSVDNFRPIDLRVKPVLPDPARVQDVAETLVEALEKGKKLLALIGFGAVKSGAGHELKQLVERYQIPFATTLDGKGIIAERHPLCAGVFCDSGHSAAWKAFLEADVVLAVGNSFAQHATFGFRDDLFAGRKLIHINIDIGEIDKVYKADGAIIGDARLAVGALLDKMSGLLEPSPPADREATDYSDEHILHLTGKIHPGQMAQSLSKRLPDNAIVLADAGAHLAWLGYYLQIAPGQNFRKPGGFGPMAGNVNGALGVKLAHPERTVIVGCGDGCYLLSGFELLTAVQYDIPVIWIVFNNAEFQLIKLYQLQSYQEYGLVDFGNPDYVAYAQACGAKGYRVETLEEFEAALEDALALGKPAIIDAHITRLALPHYSASPEGVVAGVAEMIAERIRPD